MSKYGPEKGPICLSSPEVVWLVIIELYIGHKLLKLQVECWNSLGSTLKYMYICCQVFSLSVKFFTARDGVVMFSHYFKQFCILVQIATKGPDLLQNRSRKSPDSTGKSFSPPITTYFSSKSQWQNFVSQALNLPHICANGNPWQVGNDMGRVHFGNFLSLSLVHLSTTISTLYSSQTQRCFPPLQCIVDDDIWTHYQGQGIMISYRI